MRGAGSRDCLSGTTWGIGKIRDDIERAARHRAVVAVLATVAAAPAVSHATWKLGPVGISRWQEHGVFHLRIALAVLAALAFV